ncbi:MAG TPA: Flp1 family type IVb pilin [Paenibacillus sp.]|jgi:Flp pilus assembly pilin Flp
MLTMLQGQAKGLWEEEDGLGMLEMILIIAAIIVIAVIFRKQLSDIVKSLLEKIGKKSNEFIDG